MVLVRCRLVMLDAEAQPPRVEARFFDAEGRLVCIVDKEPIFADDSDLPGQGWVRGTELRRQGEGPAARVLVSLAVPDSLETTEGAGSVEVWAKDLMVARLSAILPRNMPRIHHETRQLAWMVLCPALAGGCSRTSETTQPNEAASQATPARQPAAAAPSASAPPAAVASASAPAASAVASASAPAVASASAAPSASGGAQVSPIPAVPTALSPPPTAAEWAAGLEVNGAAESKRASQCTMKLVREWVKIRCEGDIKQVAPDWNLWHDDKDKGRLWFEDHSYPAFGELILRISPGYNMGAVFHRKDRTNSARFFFNWDRGKDRPKVLDVFRGTY